MAVGQPIPPVDFCSVFLPVSESGQTPPLGTSPMHDDKLRKALEELRTEILEANWKDAPGRERAQALLADIESRIGNLKDDEEQAGLIGNLKESIGQLEVEHPKLTRALIEFMQSLGGAGI